jgi:hypothetical protein
VGALFQSGRTTLPQHFARMLGHGSKPAVRFRHNRRLDLDRFIAEPLSLAFLIQLRRRVGAVRFSAYGPQALCWWFL